ncbi:MAG: MFS transporter, partial [Gemmatimonadales bacterium]
AIALLGFGLALTFLSSFGQTFLVSLFVPSFLDAFSLSQGGFGAMYSAATLASAAFLPWAGAMIDRKRLTRFSVGVVVLMAVSAVILAVAWSPWVLMIGLFGLRLSGPGLTSHTAMTAMARYHGATRGRALAVSGLGFPIGEALLPLLASVAIGAVGWRFTWGIVAAVSLVAFAPSLVLLLRRSGVELDPRRIETEPVQGSARSWSRRDVVRDPRFLGILPAALLSPFWVTGLFLYQVVIGEAKGWSLTLIASAFVAYAGARVLGALVTGGLVDRYSAARIFPLALLPMAAVLLVMLASDAVPVAYVYMTGLGISVGMGTTVKPALWAELYGVEHLGAIKSMMGTLMVVGTAGSPVLVGVLLDRGVSLESIFMAGAATSVLGAMGAWVALRKGPRSGGAGPMPGAG